MGSFGGDYWHDCVYAMDYSGLTRRSFPQRDSQGHYCPTGGGSAPAVGTVPNACDSSRTTTTASRPTTRTQFGSLGKTGLIDPNLKPMKQHVWTFGAAWEISNDLVFEPIYTRSRLDRTIEDSGVITPDGEQSTTSSTPGLGVNTQVPNCTGLPAEPESRTAITTASSSA